MNITALLDDMRAKRNKLDVAIDAIESLYQDEPAPSKPTPTVQRRPYTKRTKTSKSSEIVARGGVREEIFKAVAMSPRTTTEVCHVVLSAIPGVDMGKLRQTIYGMCHEGKLSKDNDLKLHVVREEAAA